VGEDAVTEPIGEKRKFMEEVVLDSSSAVEQLIDIGALARFGHGGPVRILTSDRLDLAEVRLKELQQDQYALPVLERSVEYGLFLPDGSVLSKRYTTGRPASVEAAVGALLRHLVNVVSSPGGIPQSERTVLGSAIEIGSGWSLQPSSRLLTEVCLAALGRQRTLERAAAQDLANSAYYMGTKRTLTSFISDAAHAWLSSDTAILDLMCGSGAVSGALSRTWPVMASDAMSFCRYLAAVQSGGFSESEARETVEEVREAAQSNLRQLVGRIGKSIEEEDEIFHGAEPGEDFEHRYREFVARFPTLPAGGISEDGWDPLEEVRRRRETGTGPACLFTAYFANVYFGLRQAAEIDSLRYGIFELHDERRRTWALGALIAAASRTSTAYGGHFAQPLASFRALTDSEDGRDGRLLTALRQRTFSVWGEFQARLVSLGRASEQHEYEVQLLDGPWKRALEVFDATPTSGPKAVYLDAPYKREEYSRYYHVLETLARYNYPSAEGDARMPSKVLGDRFSSEFATRTRSKVTRHLADVIDAILKAGHTCLWSYSDSASSSVEEVLTALNHRPTSVKSVAARHDHKAQGNSASSLHVHEYLIAIWP
jgi:adenine-specific DNA-methyltransferase